MPTGTIVSCSASIRRFTSGKFSCSHSSLVNRCVSPFSRARSIFPEISSSRFLTSVSSDTTSSDIASKSIIHIFMSRSKLS